MQNPYAQGCHKLIKEGALLVETVADILEAISHQYQPQQISLFDKPSLSVSKSLQAVEKEKIFAKDLPNLTACQQQIYQHINLDPISIDDLAKAVEMPIEALLVELLGLELLGVIRQVSGGYVKI